MRLKAKVTDNTWPLGIVRAKLEEHVQQWLDRGWHLRGQWSVAGNTSVRDNGTVRVFCTFVLAERGE